MDNSGNNRYELLFMDDDDSSGLAQPQIAAVVAAPKKPEPAKAPKAPKSKSEKENKPVVAARKANAPVAKNASPVKGGKGPAGGDVGRPKNPTANGANNQGRFNNNQRYGNKESNGEFGNELPQRQFNNRDNRDHHASVPARSSESASSIASRDPIELVIMSRFFCPWFSCLLLKWIRFFCVENAAL